MKDDKKLSQLENEVKDQLREVFDQYLEQNGESIPELDLSFMKSSESEQKKPKRSHRILAIAACVAVCFIVSSSMTVWINSGSAHAMKFRLEKTFHKITDGFFSTDEGEDAEASENEISITIDSMDDIDDAVAFMPDLPIPGYIPEGYELESLKVSKFVNEGYAVQYNFVDNSNHNITISGNDIVSDSTDAGLTIEAEEITLNDRTIYYYEDQYSDSRGASVLIKNMLIDVKGNASKDIVIKIISNIP